MGLYMARQHGTSPTIHWWMNNGGSVHGRGHAAPSPTTPYVDCTDQPECWQQYIGQLNYVAKIPTTDLWGNALPQRRVY